MSLCKECTTKAVSRGLCSIHYARFRRQELGCKVPGCPNVHRKDGYCSTHCLRLEKYGSLEAPVRSMEREYRGELAYDQEFRTSLLHPELSVTKDGKYVRRNYTGTILRQRKAWGDVNRYFTVNFRNTSISVHRLVLSAWKGLPPEGTEANHKDGNKENNHIDNLEWVTRSENVKHAYANGLNPGATPKRGESCNKAKLTRKDVEQIIRSSKKHIELAREFGVAKDTIASIKSGRTWRHVPRNL